MKITWEEAERMRYKGILRKNENLASKIIKEEKEEDVNLKNYIKELKEEIEKEGGRKMINNDKMKGFVKKTKKEGIIVNPKIVEKVEINGICFPKYIPLTVEKTYEDVLKEINEESKNKISIIRVYGLFKRSECSKCNASFI